jgi:glucokinase
VVVGLDLGGTDLKSAALTADGVLSDFSRRPSRTRESAGGPLAAMMEALAALRTAGHEPRAVGVGSPGAIDPASGSLVGRTAHLPHWDGYPLRTALEEASGLPVAADNDANCAALAEHRLGAAKGARVSLTLTLGTGLGCGIVADGHVFRGAFGGAGELGHVPLGSGALACACGVPSCVEPELSGSGLLRAAEAIGLSAATPAELFALAAGGEARAQDLVARMADRLGATIATATAILNPEVVVIGGGVAQAGEALIAPVRAAVKRYALASHAARLRIVPAALGERAGVVGAGLMAWERLATP